MLIINSHNNHLPAHTNEHSHHHHLPHHVRSTSIDVGEVELEIGAAKSNRSSFCMPLPTRSSLLSSHSTSVSTGATTTTTSYHQPQSNMARRGISPNKANSHGTPGAGAVQPPTTLRSPISITKDGGGGSSRSPSRRTSATDFTSALHSALKLPTRFKRRPTTTSQQLPVDPPSSQRSFARLGSLYRAESRENNGQGLGGYTRQPQPLAVSPHVTIVKTPADALEQCTYQPFNRITNDPVRTQPVSSHPSPIHAQARLEQPLRIRHISPAPTPPADHNSLSKAEQRRSDDPKLYPVAPGGPPAAAQQQHQVPIEVQHLAHRSHSHPHPSTPLPRSLPPAGESLRVSRSSHGLLHHPRTALISPSGPTRPPTHQQPPSSSSLSSSYPPARNTSLDLPRPSRSTKVLPKLDEALPSNPDLPLTASTIINGISHPNTNSGYRDADVLSYKAWAARSLPAFDDKGDQIISSGLDPGIAITSEGAIHPSDQPGRQLLNATLASSNEASSKHTSQIPLPNSPSTDSGDRHHSMALTPLSNRHLSASSGSASSINSVNTHGSLKPTFTPHLERGKPPSCRLPRTHRRLRSPTPTARVRPMTPTGLATPSSNVRLSDDAQASQTEHFVRQEMRGSKSNSLLAQPLLGSPLKQSIRKSSDPVPAIKTLQIGHPFEAFIIKRRVLREIVAITDKRAKEGDSDHKKLLKLNVGGRAKHMIDMDKVLRVNCCLSRFLKCEILEDESEYEAEKEKKKNNWEKKKSSHWWFDGEESSSEEECEEVFEESKTRTKDSEKKDDDEIALLDKLKLRIPLDQIYTINDSCRIYDLNQDTLSMQRDIAQISNKSATEEDEEDLGSKGMRSTKIKKLEVIEVYIDRNYSKLYDLIIDYFRFYVGREEEFIRINKTFFNGHFAQHDDHQEGENWVDGNRACREELTREFDFLGLLDLKRKIIDTCDPR